MKASRKILDLLRDFESRNVTFIASDGSWPIVWERARGVHVWDAEGRRYLDLTAAFGVAAAGHANPAVVRAGRAQMGRLLHAMGDVHPHRGKAGLARTLSAITFERWAQGSPPVSGGLLRSHFRQNSASAGKTLFCNTGSEAVEVALKTAMLATGRPGVIAFEGGYHGLGYGALNTTHRSHFRGPFLPQLREFGKFVPFPVPAPAPASQLEKLETHLERLFRRNPIGAVLVEPVQVRGGIRMPVPGFLQVLRRVCDRHQALLILDEIYTGFGRTGRWFACEHEQVVPDLICLGKALSGGFPLAACVGRAEVMDRAWSPSRGEAIHTSTFLGHPVGCAMALANLREIARSSLVEHSGRAGRHLLEQLTARFESVPVKSRQSALRLDVRGVGLLAGLEVRLPDGSPAADLVPEVVTRLLHRGFIFLPEGEHGNVIGFTPPLTITTMQLDQAVTALQQVLAEVRPTPLTSP